jgi:DNA polymerase I-like protein with 3'-5' exonuclease and polymerase domains
MAFAFGNLTLDTKKKNLDLDRVEPLIKNNFRDDVKDYYLVLLDMHPTSYHISSIEKALKSAGILSYVIMNSVNILYAKDKLSGSFSDFLVSNRSNWEKFLTVKGKHCKAVLTFGGAMYAVNHSADIMVEHFYDYIMSRTYYYSPRCGCNVFPVDALRETFPVVKDGSCVNYKTRFLKIQLEKIKNDNPWMPDMRDAKIVIAESATQVRDIFEQNMNSAMVAWDLETSGLDFMTERIGCITMSFDGVTGYFIPWKFVNTRQLSALLSSCKRRVGANLKFDTKFVWKNGVLWPTVTDSTDMMSHALNSDRFKGLKPLAFFYTKFGGYDEELDKFKAQTKITDYTRVPIEILSKYATLDAIVTFRCYMALREQMRETDEKFPNEKMPEWTTERFYDEVMMPVYRDFCEIEYRGLYIDMETREKNKAILQKQIAELSLKLCEIWGVPKTFNIGSTKELGKLFQKLGWEPIKLAADGSYSTADDCLAEWDKQGHEGIKELRELRTAAICLKSFLGNENEFTDEDDLKGWSQYIRLHADGSYRVHTSYKVMQTETFRCISSNPNMQNIPAHGALSRLVKECVTVPDKERYRLCTIDFGSLQCRLATIDTALNEEGIDPMLFDLYKVDTILGGDMHSSTAWGTFINPIGVQILEIIDENDKKWLVGLNQDIKIKPRKEFLEKFMRENPKAIAKPAEGSNCDLPEGSVFLPEYQVVKGAVLNENDSIVGYV